MEGNTIDFFVFDKLLGSGAFASVWRAHPIRSPVPVAIKVIPKSNLPELTRLTREISILREIRHPFISRLFHVGENASNYYIVQEYAPGRSITERIAEAGALSEAHARHYFIELMCALDYLHNTRHVVHRDIKGENVLLDEHDNIKVIDFGLSRAFVSADDLFTSACGSPCYSAPEVVRRQGYRASVDIWSSGVLLFYMTAGQLPFLGADVQATFRMIVMDQPEFRRTMSDSLIDLLKKMLCKDPDARIDIEGIKVHPWFSLNWYNGILKFADATSEDAQAPGLDPQAIARMEGDGIDCRGLPQALLTREETELTTLYSLYRRNRVTEQMAALVSSAQASDLWPCERRGSMPTGTSVTVILRKKLTRPQISVTAVGLTGQGERKTARLVAPRPVSIAEARKLPERALRPRSKL
jgi:5'-AMP-activated protein kinase catalytic alpha subunit